MSSSEDLKDKGRQFAVEFAKLTHSAAMYRREATRMLEEAEAQLAHMRYPGLHAPFFLDALMDGVTASEVDWVGGPIYVCGEGPWPKKTFLKFLKSRFFSCIDHPVFCNVVAIGTSGFGEVELSQFNRLGHSLRVFSQELLVLGLMRRADPCALVEAGVLRQIEATHPGIAEVAKREPLWSQPGLKDGVLGAGVCGPYSFDAILKHEWADNHLLRVHGYEGEGGIPVAIRRALLKRVLTEDLHGIQSPDYAHWGYSRSVERLAALVSYLLWLNKANANDPVKLKSVRAADVRWLQQRFDPERALFQWPDLNAVPLPGAPTLGV